MIAEMIGWDKESSTFSKIFSDGNITSMTFSGGICQGMSLLRSADAMEDSSYVGFAECLSRFSQERAVSCLCARSQPMLFRTVF